MAREETLSVLPLYLAVVLVPLVATSVLLPGVVRFCTARGLLDEPGGRKAHEAPVPRLGGIAIFLSLTATVGLGFAVAPQLTATAPFRELAPEIAAALSEAHRVRTPLFGLLTGGLVIFGVGLLDDLLGERFHVALKFLGQCTAAAIAVGCGVQVEFGVVPAVNALLSFLWILGIANAFNLLDNMDGLSAGVAVSSAFIFFLNAFALGEIFLCLILAAFMGSLLGFLRWNVHPARIFMGDCGALFIGFMLSSLTILEHYVSPAASSLFPVLMPPLVLAVPLMDTLSVIIIRVSEGRPIYRGDRCHLSHRLVAAGLSQPQAVKVLHILTLALGLGALNLADASVSRSLWTLVYSLSAAALVLAGLRLERQWSSSRSRSQMPVRGSTKPVEGL